MEHGGTEQRWLLFSKRAQKTSEHVKGLRKNYFFRTFPGGPVVKTSPSNAGQGVQVQPLVREIRSHMPCSQKKQNIKWKSHCIEVGARVTCGFALLSSAV